MTKSGPKQKERTVLRWLLFGVAGVVVVYLGLNLLQGRMLGALVGTTVDPRSALGQRPRSLSMERQLFTLIGADAACNYKAEKGAKTPEVRLAVPKAYINVIRTEDDGWFGSRISSLAFLASSQNFEPYRLEFPRVRKEVLDHLGITLVKRSERFPKRPGISQLGDPNELIFPSDEAKARYDAEMLRRGFTEIRTGIGVRVYMTENCRNRNLISPLFYFLETAEELKDAPGCAKSPGPFPNSVRYDNAPEVFAQPSETGKERIRSCLWVRDRHAFVILKYDEDGELRMALKCREHSNGAGSCLTSFYWQTIWRLGLSVSSKYLQQIPEFVEKTKALYDSFEAAARGQS